jgi:hypothetical protein
VDIAPYGIGKEGKDRITVGRHDSGLAANVGR